MRWPPKSRGLAPLSVVAALLLAACGGGGTGGGEEPEEQYPTQDIRFIMPFEAGSAPDTTFRKLAKLAEEQLGVPLVFVNRPGGGGTVGVSEVVHAKPDGYTIGMSPVAPLTVQTQLQDTGYQGPKDIQPIILTNAAPMVLFVNADSDIKSIDDYVKAAKENPGAIEVGMGGGLHTIIHVEVVRLERETGIELKEVPYGAGKQVLDVVNGTITSAISQPAVAREQAQAGNIRILGIFGEEKPTALEDVPLFTEAGYEVTQIPYEFVVAPKGIAKEKIQVLHDAFEKAMSSEEFTEYVNKFSILRTYAGPDELAEKLSEDAQFYADLIQELGWTK